MNTGLTIISFIVALMGLIIWLYLLYHILIKIQATELMWFLFTIFIPFAIVTQALSKALDHVNKKS